MDARQLPHVWKWFCALPLGSDFLIGTEVFFKAGLFLADSAERRYTAVVWPFRRVRTTTLVRDERPGGLSSTDRRTFRKHRAERTTWLFFNGKSEGEGRSLHYAEELRDRYSGVKKPAWSGRIHCILDGDKPFADDGRTGPSA